ncbi:hypothetical protein Metev_0657 [Methanohalobium evestigatum Z-7303]|uniref:Uncharacterized protein n=1 Tax=Methanohalobium evestigatum (strain ATCC BAA-1072 / DSM 3721 / NBRC 107634 / OCM 161 / Z-7303) TaxID=644295 RepID=D7E6T9_METEZ|nr:hypothetical protein [Methanohalobium evestigatum]ADI73563.1 hypothetical protein Metev_0657 [Methanohalobium evestigatum Z-7303]
MHWVADVNLECPYNRLETKVTKSVLDKVDLEDPETIPVHKSSTDYALFERCRYCEYGISRAHINGKGQLEGYKICNQLNPVFTSELRLEDIEPPEEAIEQ